MCGKARIFAFFALAYLFFHCSDACAALRLSVNRGSVRSVNVSLVPLHAVTALANKIGSNCSNVILNDLNSTGSFDVHVEIPDGFTVLPEGTPSTDTWTSNKRDILLTGSVKEVDDGLMNFRFYIWDVATRNQMYGKSFNFRVSSWRQAAHSIADLIYSRITGNSGYFNTHIVYVAADNGIRRIAVMDQDSANSTYITGGSEAWVGSPRFSPSKQQVIYARQGEKLGEVMLHDLESDVSSLLLQLEGAVSSLEFSPSGKEILLSHSIGGSTNILSFSLADKKLKKLTDNEFVNTSASYSPDGKSIVFSSDRSGTPQLYVMGTDGENPTQIGYGTGKYLSPMWSPRGDLIAFVKVKGSSCHIGVMKPDGTKEKSVVTDCTVDTPTWAENGRVLLYTKHSTTTSGEKSVSSLVITDLTGAHRRTLATLSDASDADWSGSFHD